MYTSIAVSVSYW